MRNLCIIHTLLPLVWFGFALQVLSGSGANAKPMEVIYPVKQSEMDSRFDDVIELIETALKKTILTDGPYILRPARIYMSPKRYYQEIRRDRELNIIWGVPTHDNIQNLIPVPIPLRKGLSGYHLLLIRKENQSLFSAVDSPESLKQLRPGLWINRGNMDVFTANGFNVVEGNSYEGLFRMLNHHRFDYIPQSIDNVFREYNRRNREFPDMVIEDTLLLYYPRPLFLLVSKSHSELAERLERGLNIMIHDGSFEQIFRKFHHRSIEQVNFNNRRIIRIYNPLLSKSGIPFNRKALWIQASDPDVPQSE